jgi:mannose-6-phosphate isomerase-like protein (cupin superfamily)
VDDVTASCEAFEVAELLARRAATGTAYLEFLRVPHLSAGLYVLPAGAVDAQAPHTEDELYFVLSGRAELRVDQRSTPVGPGSLCFVRANAPHAFHSVEEELRLLVVFGPAERVPPKSG